jgi:hypothetical protein
MEEEEPEVQTTAETPEELRLALRAAKESAKRPRSGRGSHIRRAKRRAQAREAAQDATQAEEGEEGDVGGFEQEAEAGKDTETQEQQQQQQPTKRSRRSTDVYKYYAQRYRLFSRFDEGVLLDEGTELVAVRYAHVYVTG